MTTLETEVEVADWKQILPLYGLYKLRRDMGEGKPTIFDGVTDPYELPYQAWLTGQTMCAIGALSGTAVGIYYLCQKLF